MMSFFVNAFAVVAFAAASVDVVAVGDTVEAALPVMLYEKAGSVAVNWDREIAPVLDSLAAEYDVLSARARSYASRDGSYGYNMELCRRRAAWAGENLRSALGDGVAVSSVDAGFYPDGEAAVELQRSTRVSLLMIRRHVEVARQASEEEPLPAKDSVAYVEPEVAVCLAQNITDTPAEGGVQGKTYRRPVVAIRSNLLMPLFNIGVEVPLGKVVSVEADWYYPWISAVYLDNRYNGELEQASLGVRFWLSKRKAERLRGHSIGLTAMGALYDFGKSDYDVSGSFVHMKGVQGGALGCSLDWTYCCRLGDVLNMEFCIGGGAVYHQDVEYMQYSVAGPLLRDPRLLYSRGWYFGPTKVQINLVLPLGGGYRQ